MSRNDIDATADAQAADVDDTLDGPGDTDADVDAAVDRGAEEIVGAGVPDAVSSGASVAQAARVATSRHVPSTRGVVRWRRTDRVGIRRV
ncbi:hypothetical protein [Williamsia sp. M5A3_1d]